MTLRRLGALVDPLEASSRANFQEMLVKQMKRLNDYMALMNNEASPPTEDYDDTDTTT